MKYVFFILFLVVLLPLKAQKTIVSKEVVSDTLHLIRTPNIQNLTIKTLNEFFEVYTNSTSLPGQKYPTQLQQRQLNEFVAYSKSINEKGFDYNLSAFMASSFDLSKKYLLDKARTIDSTNYFVLTQAIGVNYILSNQNGMKKDLSTLVKQKKWTTDELNYAAMTLESLPKNSVLLTHGLNDSYPILYQQYVKNRRKDVVVIPMHLLVSKQYRNRLEESAFQLPQNDLINVAYIQKMCALNDNKPIFLALTLSTSYLKPLEANLYPVGLSYHFSKIPYQNSSKNEQLWKAHLKNSLYQLKDEEGKKLAANYLPLLLNLSEFYTTSNNKKMATEIKNGIKFVGTLIKNNHLINDLEIEE